MRIKHWLLLNSPTLLMCSLYMREIFSGVTFYNGHTNDVSCPLQKLFTEIVEIGPLVLQKKVNIC